MYTPQERLKIYSMMIRMIHEYPPYQKKKIFDFGLCYLAFSAIKYFYKDEGVRERGSYLELFPEIIKHKPPEYTSDMVYWFSTNMEGTTKRLSILEQAIQELPLAEGTITTPKDYDSLLG